MRPARTVSPDPGSRVGARDDETKALRVTRDDETKTLRVTRDDETKALRVTRDDETKTLRVTRDDETRAARWYPPSLSFPHRREPTRPGERMRPARTVSPNPGSRV